VQYVIEVKDWRVAYRFLAVLAFILVPLLILFIRRSPQAIGLRLIDYDAPPAQEHEPRAVDFSWTAARAVRTRAFWLVIIAALGAIGPLRMLTVHQLAVAAGAGFDKLFAASVVGMAGAVTAVAFIFFGMLSDRIGRRKTYLIGSLCLITAILILAVLRSPQQRSWLLLYALMLGLGEGSRSSLVTAVASDLFPGPALGTINSAVGAAFGAGAAFFPWFAGFVFDERGSYNIAFLTGIVVVAISTAALWLAGRRRA
jgi:MFS family permease